jgi:hypothetical protein
MNNKQLEYIKYFLNKCGVVMDTYDDLNGMLIPREIFMNIENYKKIKDEILVLKKLFNSSALTALQSTAEENQKWPLLNLVRQILKAIHYKMIPKRVSAGYTKDGKKKYRRMFIVEKLSQTESSSTVIGVLSTSLDVGSNNESTIDFSTSSIDSIS